MEDVQGVGVWGVLLLLVLREVFGFVKGRGDVTARDERWKALSAAVVQIAELHKWHDVQDANGVKTWYVRRSLEEAVNKLATAIDGLRDFHRDEGQVLRQICERLEKMESRLPAA